jgi:hypothetical protein
LDIGKKFTFGDIFWLRITFPELLVILSGWIITLSLTFGDIVWLEDNMPWTIGVII